MEHTEVAASVRYNVEMDDLLAFTDYHLLRSATGKQIRERMRRVFAGIIAAVYFLLGLLLHAALPNTIGLWFPFLFAVLGGGLYYLFGLSRGSRHSGATRRRLVDLYSAGANRATICEHTLEITETGIVDRTPVSECRYAWAALEHIESDAKHTYLYIGAANAIVVPHEKVTLGSFPAVLQAIKLHYTPDRLLPPSA